MGSKKKSVARTAAAMTAEAISRAQRSPFDRVSEGKDAWALLQAAAHSGDKRGGRSLEDADFSKIATRAWEEFERLKPRILAKHSLTRFTQIAFGDHHTSSKELSVVRLAPGRDFASSGLRKDIRSYYRLIKAMAEVANESPVQLAKAILSGTKLDPMSHISPGTMSMLQKVDHMLKKVAERVDEEFGILALYQETLQSKIAQIEAGRFENWPMSNLTVPDLQSENSVNIFRKEREEALDPQKGFWRIDEYFYWSKDIPTIHVGDMCLIRTDEFFYVPHALIGTFLIWDLPDKRDDPVAFEAVLSKAISEVRAGSHGYLDVRVDPVDEWDSQAACPKGQTDPDEIGPLNYNFWLVIYPDPTVQRLVPCLFMPNAEEGPAYLLPITVEALSMLQRVYWISPTDCKPAFDRLVEILGEQDEDGRNPVLEALRRTATWLKFNPVLKEKAKRQAAESRFDDAFQALIGNTAKSH